MDTPARNYPPDDQRVSDADRDHAVSELSEAFQAGRITADEFEQRSGRALSARTGKDLTDLFTDLQKDNVPAARTAADRLARSPRAVGTWIATGASGAAAISLAFFTLVNVLTAGTNPGSHLPQREARRALAEQVLRRQGISISVPLPPSGAYGIDWIGIVTPAVITVLLGATYYGHLVAPAVLRWNGLIWSVQHAPNPPANGGSTLRAVSCSRPDDCIAVGVRGGQNGTLAEHWNGKTWRVTPTPLSHLESGELSELNAVSCSSPAACTAVGDGLAATPPAKQVTVAMRWNGKTWARQPTPNSPAAENELSSVSCPTATACTAIGSQGSGAGSGHSAILAAHWNGRAWKLQPVPAPSGGPGRMHAVACASATYCVAAGVNYAAAVNPPQPGGGRQWPVSVVWAGSTWKLAPVPHPQKDTQGAYLFGVDCSAATACTAVGVSTPTAAQGGPTMADRWNGTSWTLQDSATPPGDTADLTSVSCPASRVCIAVGTTGKNAVPEHMLAERWNGSAWALTPTR